MELLARPVGMVMARPASSPNRTVPRSRTAAARNRRFTTRDFSGHDLVAGQPPARSGISGRPRAILRPQLVAMLHVDCCGGTCPARVVFCARHRPGIRPRDYSVPLPVVGTSGLGAPGRAPYGLSKGDRLGVDVGLVPVQIRAVAGPGTVLPLPGAVRGPAAQDRLHPRAQFRLKPNGFTTLVVRPPPAQGPANRRRRGRRAPLTMYDARRRRASRSSAHREVRPPLRGRLASKQDTGSPAAAASGVVAAHLVAVG
jgi:hypothetical protein